MVREKILVVRGEIWTLFAIFMFIILFYYILIRLRVNDTGSLSVLQWSHWSRESINLFQTSSNKYHTNNFVIIKQLHFILIKWNFYDQYFIDVCTFLKKIHFSGPRDSKLWVWWSVRSEWLATADLYCGMCTTTEHEKVATWTQVLMFLIITVTTHMW
jgi:hypothetical protein